MIRELLEKNGLLCKDKLDIIYYGNDNEFEVFAIIDRTKKELLSYLGIKTERITDNQAIEQACRQYVKENGFKLEWLNYNPSIEKHKHTNWLYQENVPSAKIDKNTNCIKEIFGDEKGTIWGNNKKLLAWLYANDIEIKEDNNGM